MPDFDAIYADESDDGGKLLTWTEQSRYGPLGSDYQWPCPPPAHSEYNYASAGKMITSGSPDPVKLDWEEIPGWREAAKKGDLLPFTRYHVKSKSFVCQNSPYAGNCCKTYTKARHRRQGDATGISSVHIPMPPEVEQPDLDYLLQKAWADVKSQGLDILTELAEAPKTVDMFRSYVNGVKKRTDHVSKAAAKKRRKNGRGLGSKASSVIDAFGSAWMETRYGWRPIVYASEEIAETYEAWKKPNKVRVSARKSQTTNSSTGDSTGLVYYPYGANMEGTKFKLSNTLIGRARVVLDVKAGSVPTWTSINPVATAWELVPLSFVVDWFVNSSDLVRAHWPSASTAGSTACTSLKSRVTLDFSFNRKNNGESEYEHHFGDDCRFLYSATEYKRTPTNVIPWRLKWDPRLSIAKITDLGFILRSAVKGKIPRAARSPFFL